MANSSTDNPPWISEIQIEVPQLGPKLEPCAHKASKHANKKRLVICCDGTWNNSNQKGSISTNVARLSAAVAHKCCTGMPQVVYYHRGAGTEESKVAQYLGGVLGKGIIQDIADVYRFICDNYNPGDELVIVGFSRGAFTARSVAGMVCSIGLLNRVGLASFGDVFHDYQSFPNWLPGTIFDPQQQLVGFTLANYERLERFRSAPGDHDDDEEHSLDHAAMERELDEDKRKFFERVTQCQARSGERGMDLAQMAARYRDFLEKHQMILCERRLQERDGKTDWYFAPVDVTIQAVGVWDTVGSLGWPKMPWEKLRKNRSADELRFASLDVHPNVEHAFHALALDEWRTAFAPTLWGRRGNDRTKLRQVWFPGSHSNVGGGFEDQQIATIALAWMADQLTSIGVEFSTPEMKRIFHLLEPGVAPRPWSSGRISSPSASSAIPDRAYNALWYPWRRLTGGNPVAGARTPGSYREDGGRQPIREPNELVHPCARVRYLYGGMGLDDEGEWDCGALTRNGFQLVRTAGPPEDDDAQQHPVASTYETLSGTVASVRGGHVINDTGAGRKLVLHQLPHESDLHQLDAAENSWSWSRDDGTTLPEERVGMWERLYIRINHDLCERQRRRERKQQREQPETKSLGVVGRLRSLVMDRIANARGLAGSILEITVERLLPSPGKPFPLEYNSKFGYHDFVSWQKGDTSPKTKTGMPSW
ncbi:hypothetical protein CMUS01_10151 [Colletotrichum musicola]|uniref:T6SS Phospholipase effector Tle1-like catalytic domain-containing protein n=1 Tax=Colletotrichum musicola TaxID=2175873 RepID=A0A8H6K4B7_9PEZI|nr:hypothetical protein CMUS01_10151 [Colletotrichum musicola]